MLPNSESFFFFTYVSLQLPQSSDIWNFPDLHGFAILMPLLVLLETFMSIFSVSY